MYRFIETIRIDHGKICNLSYHNQRLNNTRTHFWPESPTLQLTNYLPSVPENGIYKLRVIYSRDGIEEITCTPYTIRPVHSLALIQADNIDYAYKNTNRDVLNQLFTQRGSCDDILIVRHNLLTDTSIANIAFSDSKCWYTPQYPLMKGTKRTELLDKGILVERNICIEDIPSYSTIRLFNAMIDWGELELPFSLTKSGTVLQASGLCR